jgi:hypothetical protein
MIHAPLTPSLTSRLLTMIRAQVPTPNHNHNHNHNPQTGVSLRTFIAARDLIRNFEVDGTYRFTGLTVVPNPTRDAWATVLGPDYHNPHYHHLKVHFESDYTRVTFEVTGHDHQ